MAALKKKSISNSKSSIDMLTGSGYKDLLNKIYFTFFIIFIYRLGTFVPLPGININVISDITGQYANGVLGMFDLFSGGALGRMTIFSLNILPYISASIIMQILGFTVPKLQELRNEGEAGRSIINQYTRYLTIIIAAVQGFGIAMAISSTQSADGISAVLNPGIFFIISTIITLVAGTFVVLWLGEQITAKGIGNGVSLIVFAGIVASLPSAIYYTLDLAKQGSISVTTVIGVLALVLAVVYFVVFIETAQRRISVQYPKQMANRMVRSSSSYLPIKINLSGVIPPIFASAILLVPISFITLISGDGEGLASSILSKVAVYLGRGQPLYLLLYAALIVVFVFMYVSIVFNVEKTAENLKKGGGFIHGIRPGSATEQYFRVLLQKINTIGAIYLVLVCLIPEFIISKFSVPFYFGGTSLLIVVSVTIDTITQAQSHLLSRKYGSAIRKSNIGKR